MPYYLINRIRARNDHHTHAAVERAQHVLFRDVAVRLQQRKNRQRLDFIFIYLRAQPVRHDAVQVAADAAARDVRPACRRPPSRLLLLVFPP